MEKQLTFLQKKDDPTRPYQYSMIQKSDYDNDPPGRYPG